VYDHHIRLALAKDRHRELLAEAEKARLAKLARPGLIERALLALRRAVGTQTLRGAFARRSAQQRRRFHVPLTAQGGSKRRAL
jgi:hypothetical protein